ncbi:SLATT domain-containing protein [Clavibacter tessellarius]|uniref:SLATT domain-containing protein n=1 Tax=Clavibacter tessellarius TaxID=31965 RepID=UPI0039E7A8CC
MDQLESTGSTDTERTLLLGQVREIYGRIAYTHKTHEVQADIFEARSRKHRIIKFILVAAGSGTFIASLAGVFLDPKWGSLVTSFVAVVVAGASLADRTFRYGEEMQQHRNTAAQLWDIRESYLSLIVDLKAGNVSTHEAVERRGALQKAAGAVLRDAPRTSPEAYMTAQDRLKNREDLTFTSAELDLLLPEALRGNEPNNNNGSEYGNDADR